MWSYEPNNLVAFKMMGFDGVAFHSSFVDYKYPKSGYAKAFCNSKGLLVGWRFKDRDSDHYKLNHELLHQDCTCGLYGSFDLHFTDKPSGLPAVMLIEYGGKVLVGENQKIRGETIQVVASVDVHDSFSYPENARPNIASAYFDIPIISIEEAYQLIEQQKEKWLS